MARHPDILVPVREQTDIASARRAALRVASRAGFAEEDAGGVALVVTEVASNQIKHAGGGELILRDVSSTGAPCIEILALDSGKGMENLARCFADGFSTAGSSGNGLGAILRLSTFHDVYSQRQKGTVLVAQVRPGEGPGKASFDIGAVTIPYPGETACGDAWDCDVRERRIRIIMADGLGHGPEAGQASAAAISLFKDGRNEGPAAVIESSHPLLKATRGAAIAVADINGSTGAVSFAGVGNIAGAVIAANGSRRQMISMHGTLGHEMRTVREFEYELPPGGLVILHSDGIGTHWGIDQYPGLMGRHPSIIAGVLFRDFRRIRDDATIVVLHPHAAPV